MHNVGESVRGGMEGDGTGKGPGSYIYEDSMYIYEDIMLKPTKYYLKMEEEQRKVKGLH
jgi:hypothetical protein